MEEFSGYLAQKRRAWNIWLAVVWGKSDQPFNLNSLRPFLRPLKVRMEMTYPELSHLPLTQCYLVPCHHEHECLKSMQQCFKHFTDINLFHPHNNSKTYGLHR